jgi:hypothetical protein
LIRRAQIDCLDACAVIAYLRREAGAEVIKESIEIYAREGIFGKSGHRDVINASRTEGGSGVGRLSRSSQTCTEWAAAISTSSRSCHTL